jgi:hypothetical protein
MAEARDADCETIQAELSEMADRRGRRSRRITSHLRVCNQCREFREGLRYRPSVVGDCAPSRLDALRNSKVAAIVAGLVALVGGGLAALGALGSAGQGAPTTAERHHPKAPIAPAVTPRVVTVPTAPKAAHGGASARRRGSARHTLGGLRMRLRPTHAPAAHAPAAGTSHARGDDTAGTNGEHRPTATVRRNVHGKLPATIRPQAGGGAIPVPRDDAPQPGSGSGSGDATTGSGGSSGSAPDTAVPSGAASPPEGPSGGAHPADPGSTDRPVVTHNDSTADPNAADAAGSASDGAAGPGDADPPRGPGDATGDPPAGGGDGSPPPLVTSDADTATP